MRAQLRVGEEMHGSPQIYNASAFKRAEIIGAGGPQKIAGQLGDRPAIVIAPPFGEGLATLLIETRPERVHYREWSKFTDFVAHKSLEGVLAEHFARGLPKTGFIERYSRFAKSLLAIGEGRGEDRVHGLRHELVALANPYVMAGDELPVRLLFEGAPLAGAQIEVFARNDGEVTIFKVQTDDDGVAIIPLEEDTEYLLDAVKMLALENEEDEADEAVWHSLWASLTFHTP